MYECSYLLTLSKIYFLLSLNIGKKPPKFNKHKTERTVMEETINQPKEILNRHEVAKLLGVSLTQVERFKRQGKLPYIKLSHKCVRYRRSDCEKLLVAYTINKGARN